MEEQKPLCKTPLMRFYTLAVLSGLMFLGLIVGNGVTAPIAVLAPEGHVDQIDHRLASSTNPPTGTPYRGSGRRTTVISPSSGSVS